MRNLIKLLIVLAITSQTLRGQSAPDLVVITEKAKKGDADACSYLALQVLKRAQQAFYKQDQVAYKKLREEAIQWFIKSAESGDMGSQFELGEMYSQMSYYGERNQFRGDNITDADCDYKSAMKWYLMAANSKHPHPGAMFRIGMLYLEGKGVPQNTETAINWLEQGSNAGASWASEKLLDIYLEGEVTNKNIPRAIMILNEMAERGSYKALLYLGKMYYFGNDVPVDHAVAFKSLKALVASNSDVPDTIVYYILGNLYEDGKVTPQDLEKAFKYHMVSAQSGYTMGQFCVAQDYYFGKGTRIDYKESTKWFRLAAENGFVVAQHTLAKILTVGKVDVPADPIEGFKWYKQAALAGYNESQMATAIAYYMGTGTPQNFVEAYAWANLVASSGKVDKSKELRDEIISKLSPEQIAEGQLRSKELNDLINAEITDLKKLQKVTELKEKTGA